MSSNYVPVLVFSTGPIPNIRGSVKFEKKKTTREARGIGTGVIHYAHSIVIKYIEYFVFEVALIPNPRWETQTITGIVDPDKQETVPDYH